MRAPVAAWRRHRRIVAEYVTTHSLMLALVAAAIWRGFSTAAHRGGMPAGGSIVRPLEDSAALTTHLLRSQCYVGATAPLSSTVRSVSAICRWIRNGSHEAVSGGLADSIWSNRQTRFVIAGFH